MLILFSKVVIGRARSDITTAQRMYISTLLKYQQIEAIKQKPAA
jgi:hypothetical protein